MRSGRRKGAGKRDRRVTGLGVREPTLKRVYGVNIYDELRDKLVDHMNELRVEMASGYETVFSYVYDHHRMANLQLNSVSVDIEEADVEETLGGAVTSSLNAVIVVASIRAHVAYDNGFLDSRDSTRLVQSIDNWLHEHMDLGDNFWIITTGPTNPMMSFSESASQGGQLIIRVRVYTDYVQT